ncbi:uncharacterized protein [Rutidosis leptorrhynchoides]|uniref:uncharacterized protein n=1 Tax=Rutidosis leptorrhynchoides TaxID=125765 RepID=UPI003A9A4DA2
MTSSSSSSSSSRYSGRSLCAYVNHERFVRTKIEPAIEKGKSCTICINEIHKPAVITVCLHAYCTNCIRKWSTEKRKCPLCNAQFDSLFVEIDLNSKTYRTLHLSAVRVSDTKLNNYNFGSRRNFAAQRRAIGISRVERNAVNRRTRPLPRQRSFGKSSMLSPNARQERILQWRASIYEQNLRAELCPSRSSLKQFQSFTGRSGFKERIVQIIEPWIFRELDAILGDPNPAVLVHLVTSLYISSLEERQQGPSGRCSVENNYLERLQPFLLERTCTFWHELGCFAESSFNMETYDTVVKYVKWSK